MLGRIVIIQAFDRGLWLAQNLSQRGLKCTVVDLTSALEGHDPEMCGLFKSHRFDTVAFQTLNELTPLELQPEGFCVWTEKGVVEARGWLSQYQLQNQIPTAVTNYLGESDATATPNWQNKIGEIKFQSAYLAHLAHQLFSPVEKEFPESISGDPMPLLSEFYLRRRTSDSQEKYRKYLAELGHEVFVADKLTDVRITPQGLSSVCFSQNSKSEEAPGAVFFWCLTRAETEFLSSAIAKAMFKTPATQSRWTWLKFNLKPKTNRLLNQIPKSFLMIGSLMDVWAYENMLWVKKISDGLEVWTRGASYRIQDKAYLDVLANKIRERFEAKIPDFQLESYTLPQFVDVPSPWQVFDGVEDHLRLEVSNVWMVGPDASQTFDPLGMMDCQAEAFKDFLVKLSKLSGNKSDEVHP